MAKRRIPSRRTIAERNALAVANDKLAIWYAKRYIGYGIDLDDLAQEARRGLLHAAEIYDESKGFKFCTYAGRWIRSYLQDAVRDRMIHCPRRSFEDFMLVTRTMRRLSRQWDRPVELTEAAEHAGIRNGRFQCMLHASQAIKAHLVPLLPVYRSAEPTTEFEDNEQTDYIVGLLAELDEVHRDVLVRRFGIGRPAQTVREAASEIGVSCQTVSNREHEAIASLRRYAELELV